MPYNKVSTISANKPEYGEKKKVNKLTGFMPLLR